MGFIYNTVVLHTCSEKQPEIDTHWYTGLSFVHTGRDRILIRNDSYGADQLMVSTVMNWIKLHYKV